MREDKLPICPSCKAKAKCFCNAGGKNGEHDEFVLICSCGYEESVEMQIGRRGQIFCGFEGAYPKCPFCYQDYTKHVSPPVQSAQDGL